MAISSLSRLCIQSVAENMEMWCESAKSENFYKYLYVVGPFNCFDSTMLQQLLDFSYPKKLLKFSYFPLLFHENITKLDLSKYCSMLNDQVLKLLCLRCEKLTHLNLNNCSRLTNACLVSNIPSLLNLRSLKLANGKASDELLVRLGRYCRKLEELVVYGTKNITDAGIMGLLSKERDFGCFEIGHLDVLYTSITSKCLQTILVRLPKLKKLCFGRHGLLEKDQLDIAEVPLLKVEYLHIVEFSLSYSDFKLLINHCPNLAVLLTGPIEHFTDLLTNHFINLLHLKSLTLSDNRQDIVFQDVEKFLFSRGHQLKSLSLLGVSDVYISAIALNCKSLKELSLASCSNIQPVLPSFYDLTEVQRSSLPENATCLSDFCPQLSSIDFSHASFVGHPESVAILNLFINFANLRKLRLQCLKVNDEVLEHVFSSSSAINLSALYLSLCNDITESSVRGILNMCHNLRVLNVSGCKQISLPFVSKLRKNLKQSCKALELIWE